MIILFHEKLNFVVFLNAIFRHNDELSRFHLNRRNKIVEILVNEYLIDNENVKIV